MALYLFADDLENLYIDFAGQSVVLPNNVAKVIWNDVLGNTTYLGDEIPNGLKNPFIGEENAKQSINDIINTFVGKFGETWTLNTLINGLVKMFDVDLSKLITDLGEDASGILNLLGISSADDIMDANGDVDLMKLLSGTLSKAFKYSQTKDGNAITYKADISGPISTLAGSFGLGDLFKKNSNDNELSLNYTEENNALKEFFITAKLAGFDRFIDGKATVPEITIKINKLRVQKANDNNGIDVDKANFSPDIALNEKLSVKLDGLKWREVNLSGKTFELSLVGKIDLTTLATATNKTAVNITLDEITSTSTKHVVQASYKNGIIAAALSDAITFNGKQYKGLKIDVSEKFNVAELITQGIKEIVYRINPTLRPSGQSLQNEANATTAAGLPTADIEKWVKLIKRYYQIALPMIGTENNGLQIDLSKVPNEPKLLGTTDRSLISVISAFVNIANQDKQGYKPWTVGGCIENTVNNLIYPPYPDKGLQDCLNLILGEFNIDLSGFGATTADEQPVTPPAQDENKIDWAVIGNAVKQILFNIASDLTVEGAQCDKNFTKDEITSIIGEKKDAQQQVIPVSDDTLNKWNANKKLIRNVIALLKTTSAVVKGDLTNGAHLSVEVGIADASVEIKESLELIADYNFVDVAELYKADKEDGKENLWIVYNWTDGNDQQ